MRATMLSAGCAAVLALAGPDCGGHTRAGALTETRRSPASASAPTQTGRSVQGRVIVARERGNPAGAAILVVGCIDGNEPAGIAIVHRLEALAPPPAAALWTIADLNPDGVHANTRQNARGVDLNRNFPFRWQPIGVRGDPEFSGARALSEPESRFAYQLILQVKPRITIWFHQPLGLVDESGGDPAVERRFAALAGLPLVRLPRYPGSASGWQNHRLPRTTAFVVELPPGRASARDVARWASAVHGLLPSLSSGR